jgi:hypothetical protein
MNKDNFIILVYNLTSQYLSKVVYDDILHGDGEAEVEDDGDSQR